MEQENIEATVISEVSIARALDAAARERVLAAFERQYGVRPKIGFIEEFADSKTGEAIGGRYYLRASGQIVGDVYLRGQRDANVNAGVFYEELQHAIDDITGGMPRPPPGSRTIANAEYHLAVFERMANNPLFDITER